MTTAQRLLTWALTWVRDQRLRLAQGRVDAARSRLAFEEERPAVAAAQDARRQANLRRLIRWTERLDRAATRYDRMAAERRDEQAQQDEQARQWEAARVKQLNDWADEERANQEEWDRLQAEEQEKRDEDDRWHESRRDDDDRGWW